MRGRRCSVIIPARNEGKNLKMTVDSFLGAQEAAELIVLDDGSQDGCAEFLAAGYGEVRLLRTGGIGPAHARNRGAELARGDVLVFADAHVRVPKGWLRAVLRALEDPAVAGLCPAIAALGDEDRVGYGQTWDSRLKVRWLPRPKERLTPVPLLPGGFLVVRRETFEAVGGFNRGFRGWGHEDEELSLRLWLFGHNLFCLRTLTVSHLFRRRHPYRVTSLETDHNLLRMAVSHFSVERLARTVRLLPQTGNRLLSEVILGSALRDRERWFYSRVRTDDWFMERFSIPF